MLSCFIWGPASTIGLPAQNTTAIRQHLQNLPESASPRQSRQFIIARAPIYNTVFASEYRSCSPNCRQQISLSVSFFLDLFFFFRLVEITVLGGRTRFTGKRRLSKKEHKNIKRQKSRSSYHARSAMQYYTSRCFSDVSFSCTHNVSSV